VRYVFDLGRLERLTPGQRARALELLKRFNERRRFNPLEAYSPLTPQRAFHESQAKLRGFFGGNRAGKTTGGIVDDLIQAAPEQLLPEHLRPYKRFRCPFYCRVTCPDYSNVLVPVILQKLRDWTPLALLRDQNFDRAYDKANKSLRLECGCRFDFMTYQQELSQFGGAALHRVHYDEEPPQDIRNECKARLLDFGGDEILTMTPLQGMTPWAYDEVWMRREQENVFCVQADMEDNPHLNEEAVQEFLASLPPEERQARKEGSFVHFGGLVYPMWAMGRCAPPSLEQVKAHGDYVVAVDPGVRVTAVSFLAFDGENRALKFAELKMVDAIVPDVVREIRQVERSWELDERRTQYVIDPAAAARSALNGVTLETEYAVHGLYCMHAFNDVEAGVAMTRRRLKTGGFRHSTACVETDWEAARYRIDQDTADGKFRVIKEHDHCMDSDRYGLMTRPWYDAPALPGRHAAEDAAFGPGQVMRGRGSPVAGQYV
jgi:phage terminase large subunit-like protein